eukprot:g37720.t1
MMSHSSVGVPECLLDSDVVLERLEDCIIPPEPQKSSEEAKITEVGQDGLLVTCPGIGVFLLELSSGQKLCEWSLPSGASLSAGPLQPLCEGGAGSLVGAVLLPAGRAVSLTLLRWPLLTQQQLLPLPALPKQPSTHSVEPGLRVFSSPEGGQDVLAVRLDGSCSLHVLPAVSAAASFPLPPLASPRCLAAALSSRPISKGPTFLSLLLQSPSAQPASPSFSLKLCRWTAAGPAPPHSQAGPPATVTGSHSLLTTCRELRLPLPAAANSGCRPLRPVCMDCRSVAGQAGRGEVELMVLWSQGQLGTYRLDTQEPAAKAADQQLQQQTVQPAHVSLVGELAALMEEGSQVCMKYLTAGHVGLVLQSRSGEGCFCVLDVRYHALLAKRVLPAAPNAGELVTSPCLVSPRRPSRHHEQPVCAVLLGARIYIVPVALPARSQLAQAAGTFAVSHATASLPAHAAGPQSDQALLELLDQPHSSHTQSRLQEAVLQRLSSQPTRALLQPVTARLLAHCSQHQQWGLLRTLLVAPDKLVLGGPSNSALVQALVQHRQLGLLQLLVRAVPDLREPDLVRVLRLALAQMLKVGWTTEATQQPAAQDSQAEPAEAEKVEAEGSKKKKRRHKAGSDGEADSSSAPNGKRAKLESGRQQDKTANQATALVWAVLSAPRTEAFMLSPLAQLPWAEAELLLELLVHRTRRPRHNLSRLVDALCLLLEAQAPNLLHRLQAGADGAEAWRGKLQSLLSLVQQQLEVAQQAARVQGVLGCFVAQDQARQREEKEKAKLKAAREEQLRKIRGVKSAKHSRESHAVVVHGVGVSRLPSYCAQLLLI